MTNEEILELAKTCGFDSFTGEKENFWECWEHGHSSGLADIYGYFGDFVELIRDT